MNEIHLLLLTGAILFSCGLALIVTKKNALMALMGIELLLNAANLNFIVFARMNPAVWHKGQFFALFVIVLAAAEAAVGLALILRMYRFFKTVDLDKANQLKG